ncbi:MAG TPA: methyltransferase domain-containing protein [Planctomycetota bacterium]|nr:methyltransferase domain-containing protein [Planctomycetota bacterium]
MSGGNLDYGGQRRNMEDDSMRGTLAAQANVIWPKEREILRRRHAMRMGRVLDLACGTGEILRRVRDEFRPRLATGLDLFRGHLLLARGPVVQGDGYRAPFKDGAFDLVLVRHVLQALPDPVGLLREARRLLAPGGRAHLLVEDYAAILFDVDDYATADHFREVAPRFRARGTDLYQGRRIVRHLRAAGFSRVEVEPLLVDNLTADRDELAKVFHWWREGYASVLAEVTGRSEAEIRARFDRMIDNVRDPGRYAAWLLLAVDAAP